MSVKSQSKEGKIKGDGWGGEKDVFYANYWPIEKSKKEMGRYIIYCTYIIKYIIQNILF